ncbi:ethanolamine ammonia-lyase subunit EutB [Sorangium atrum]|uniref:Ethanolamine ammonia-lyase subunit EutB n=1 Tax=Sorangium atrum TaxID=2995308 RepID=A0ABT5BZH5_9BACT|nr:ethanolamine ammonia-lyase subunit EutB [Sorangium aterium]MDC0679558.1 ethanolamine ammonia-lyase subunit EutB [Sorangium aterium]
MKEPTPLDRIEVPRPRTDVVYAARLPGPGGSFRGLKRLLGAADCSKAGDRHAGLAASDDAEREAARELLGELTLEHLHDHPLTDARGEIDAVMRVNYDIDRDAFAPIASLRLGELKDHLLRATGLEVARLGRALTGVMAAALAKLCDVHELVYLARKISRPTRARTLLGAPGTLASRLQPNHPTDDLRGMTLLIYWGLSIGAGDALLGVNPAAGTVETTAAILRHLDRIRRAAGVPTQICCLSHLKVQLAALDQGAPVEILFQSLAGTESCCVTEFDVTVDLIDEGYRRMAARGPLAGQAEQFMYFETGQGSELTYGKHEGIDMATAEALCYGLARRWDPFMLNNVTGFIGPETHLDDREMILANLQDHFMGKLLGVPMGMAPCYTLHAHVTLEGQQMATQLLTAAGANYYMDVCLNTDRMLAYFDTSGHDVQTLRELHGRAPGGEFLEWALARGILARAGEGQGEAGAITRGPRFGDVRQFCPDEAELAELLAATPAAHGFATAGPRPANAVSRRGRRDEAIARSALATELREGELARVAAFRLISTTAASKGEHLGSADAGARLSAESAARLAPEEAEVQIVVSDGLSAEAVHRNLPDLLPVLLDGLGARGVTVGQPLLARYGRVKLAEAVAERLAARLVVVLLGERPGSGELASSSLSAYLAYRLPPGADQEAAAAFSGNPVIGFEYTVISNIHAGGLPAAEAGGVIVEKAVAVLAHRAAGNRLEASLAGGAA